LNLLLTKTYPDSTAVNYTYDNDSRLTQVTDPTGTYQFTFDNMGRLSDWNDTVPFAFTLSDSHQAMFLIHIVEFQMEKFHSADSR